MKKFWQKLGCLTIAACCALTATACGMETDVDIDKTKTQLYIGLTPNGYGDSWLTTAIDRFQTQYADYEFEPGSGKHGAQVIVQSIGYGSDVEAKIADADYTIAYTSDVNYHSFITKGLLYDMTSIVDAKFADTDENGAAVQNSIGDKFLNAQDRASYTENGKIYALPYTPGDFGITYDRDLFEEKGLFFLADPARNNFAYYTGSEDNKVYTLGKSAGNTLSVGRDGVLGTADDGLPATYEQFYFLMNKMIDLGITPITWTGKLHSYLTQMLYCLWANNEGAANMRMIYDLTGTANDIIDIDAGGNITYRDPIAINSDNGYVLQNQVGKYQALDFLYHVIDILKGDEKGNKLVTKETIDHIAAQDNFLMLHCI